MGPSVVESGPRLAVVLLVLTAIAALAGQWSGLGQGRPVLVASLRAVVQLAGVSAGPLIVVGALWLSASFVAVMVAVATVTAAGRATGRPLSARGRRDRLPPVALAVVSGPGPVVALIVASGWSRCAARRSSPSPGS